MTKKSPARLKRDAIKKAEKDLPDNQCWDELNQIHDAAKITMHQHNMIGSYKNNPELFAYLPEPKKTALNLRSLAADIKELNEEIDTIHALHKDKTGGSKDIDTVMGTLDIATQYQQVIQKHDAVVLPTAYAVLEDFAQAEKRMLSAAAAAGVIPVEGELIQAAQAPVETSPQQSVDVVDVEVTQQPSE